MKQLENKIIELFQCGFTPDEISDYLENKKVQLYLRNKKK